ncbi:alpha/beta fold hydrolase [Nocardioides daejeonensis]|uniref:alpha/beta fold hydrolase n=1 Tax=Nocardioides daejeonensis TaxID=1046556 RepID=UPI000D74EEB9|nr:alpha/beta hydrolase [Nocardioides daejeonensis]
MNDQSPTRGLHVVDSGGAGRPVVLIHGWPLSGESWQAQLDPIHAAGYRVISYDRRGFGRSRPGDRYDYDTLADDLAGMLTDLDLQDVTLVGFSMGGGEVARYVARHGEDRLHSLVFAAAVPPYLMRTSDNPDGPLTAEQAEEMRKGLEQDRSAFFDDFVRTFFSSGEEPLVDDDVLAASKRMCHESDPDAALACMDSFSTTDFRDDLTAITRPTLVIHGDADQIVPLEGAGQRTHDAVAGSRLHVIAGGPHGINASHVEEFNRALVDFLAVR